MRFLLGLADRGILNALAAIDVASGKHPLAERGLNSAPPGIAGNSAAAAQYSGHFAVVLDEEVVSRPIINFVDNPSGIDGRTGAQIEGSGTSTLTIHGGKPLKGVNYSIIPDRVEAGTYITAAAITGGEITVQGADVSHLATVLGILRKVGVDFEEEGNTLKVRGASRYNPVDVQVAPYPGFPTDMQAQMTAFLATIEGTSRVEDHIYSDRFRHIGELRKLGAEIEQDSHGVLIRGGRPLSGCHVEATDLRASAALILAGLAASEITEVSGLEHLDRGYERMFEKLSQLGASMARMPRLPGELPAQEPRPARASDSPSDFAVAVI